MVDRTSTYLRPIVFVGGQAFALMLLTVDARREWSGYGFVLFLLLLGALAVAPALMIDLAGFRRVTLVTQTIGAGVMLVVLADTADKRALWTYAVAALVAMALPTHTSSADLGRMSVLGVALAALLTIGIAAPALAWRETQPAATVCLRPGASVDDVLHDSNRFDPDQVIAGFSLDDVGPSCLEVQFDPGALASDAAEVGHRYLTDPRVLTVNRQR